MGTDGLTGTSRYRLKEETVLESSLGRKHTTTPEFRIEGEFRGFFRDVFDRHGLVLQIEDEEIFLKVPKALRKTLKGRLAEGARVVATGFAEFHAGKSLERRVVSQIRLANGSECMSCPIRVCVKKHCWRQGGKEIWRSLEQRIATANLDDTVKLEEVDCFGECKHGPNLEFAGHSYRNCTVREAEKILEPFFAGNAARTEFHNASHPMSH
ncbi:MAG TPA: (2Fe-2S) ferredoxin domain-containing protein [Candidatus Methylacidiphilales bacterium]